MFFLNSNKYLKIYKGIIFEKKNVFRAKKSTFQFSPMNNLLIRITKRGQGFCVEQLPIYAR